jgi:N-acetylglucosaminyldiphosphoundecaprenol N-acetyl-beta-D-mannosaminyltransferase
MSASPQLATVNPAASLNRVEIGHARIHNLSFSDAAGRLIECAQLSQPEFVVTANAQHLVLLENDPHFREIYANAAFVLADGASLLLGARLLRKKLSGRVTGIELFYELCARAASRGLSVFLLGGRPGSAKRAAEKLRKTHPALRIAGVCCPPLGFENDELQMREVARAVRDAQPNILFVAFGAPKQEYWIYNNHKNIGVPLSIGVGGAFEMFAGVVPRAPLWMQKAGLEWVFRLIIEPRRMWRRYLIGNLQFMGIIFKQMLRDHALYAARSQPNHLGGRP